MQLDSGVFAAVIMNFCCVDSLKPEVRINEPVTEHSHEQGYKQKQGLLCPHIAFSPFLLTVPGQDTHQFRIALSIVKGNESKAMSKLLVMLWDNHTLKYTLD